MVDFSNKLCLFGDVFWQRLEISGAPIDRRDLVFGFWKASPRRQLNVRLV